MAAHSWEQLDGGPSGQESPGQHVLCISTWARAARRLAATQPAPCGCNYEVGHAECMRVLGGGDGRARSHCRFVLALIHFIPDSLT
jgi:hypothetical protein